MNPAYVMNIKYGQEHASETRFRIRTRLLPRTHTRSRNTIFGIHVRLHIHEAVVVIAAGCYLSVPRCSFAALPPFRVVLGTMDSDFGRVCG